MSSSVQGFDQHAQRVIHSFYLIIFLFAVIGICALAVSQLQAYVLDSVRAYVGGEGLWSKGEKAAIYRLTRYSFSHDDADYRAFLDGIAVTLGDRQARLALQQPEPDTGSARKGFLQGGNHPADVDNMIHFFLQFRDISYMSKAIDIWTRADALIGKLQQQGQVLHAEVRSGHPDRREIEAILGKVDGLNRQLTKLEIRFSSTLGEAARWSRRLTRNVVYLSVALLFVTGLLFSWRIVRRIHQDEQAQRLAATVFHTAAEGIVVTDTQGNIQAVNPTFSQITGYAAGEVVGRNPRLLSSGHHDAGFFQRMWRELAESGRWSGEIWNRRKSGQIYPEWLSISAINDQHGAVAQYVGIFSDITDRKEREQRVWHQAHHDILTDLPNRVLFRDRLSQALLQARRQGNILGLLFVDVDDFKAVNDNYGHRVGDKFLEEVSARFRRSVRASDTVARIGGDEFTIILPNLHDMDGAERVAAQIIEACSDPFSNETDEMPISVSIGIALYPQHADSVEELIHRADLAMYAAKRADHRSFCFYDDIRQE